MIKLMFLIIPLYSCSTLFEGVVDAVNPFDDDAGLEFGVKVKTDAIDGNKTVGTEADIVTRVTGKKQTKTTTTTNTATITAESIEQGINNYNPVTNYNPDPEIHRDWLGILMAIVIGFLFAWLLLPSWKEMNQRSKTV